MMRVNTKQSKSTASLSRDLKTSVYSRITPQGHATIKEQSCEFSRDSTALVNCSSFTV